MQCLILIKKVQVYIIHKLIYCGWCLCVCECAHVCVWVDLSDRLRCSLAMGNTTRQGSYFSKGHILTISRTVKRICPSTGEYIMHADSPNFNFGRSKWFNAGSSLKWRGRLRGAGEGTGCYLQPALDPWQRKQAKVIMMMSSRLSHISKSRQNEERKNVFSFQQQECIPPPAYWN